ncbi:MAG: PAS domain-containing sensor histidine kinase [Oscillospiraceae bacterium]|nr:PAS domain-containing sensor histidine kinase [Oscillospiraceae bacterium]
MFKNISLRTSILFVIFVIVTELAAGLFGMYKAVSSVHKEFSKSINRVFTDDFRKELTDAANAVEEEAIEGEIIMSESEPDNIENISDLVMDATRSLKPAVFFLLDETGNTLAGSDGSENKTSSAALDSAFNGNTVLSYKHSADMLEYALPLKIGDTVKYIVYIKDDLTVQNRIVKHLASELVWLIIISAILAYLLSLLLAKALTKPLRTLASDAKKLADGVPSGITKTDRKDEIGAMTNALIYLSEAKKEQADKALAEKTKMEKILQNMNDGILAFDMKGNLTHINPEAKRLLNRNFVDDITFNKFFKEINADITLESLQYTPSEDFAEREIRLNEQMLQFSFVLFSRDSSEGGVIVIIHDVTRHERLESARRDFVADVSHELRTPLTVIKSYADILADTPDAEPQLRTRFLNTISSETDRMTKIISDLLTLSKLDVDANYATPHEEIDIRSMLEGLVDRLSLSAKKKNQKLVYTPINDVPTIKGDRDGLERVFTNIITNALKYTPSGGSISIFSSNVYNDILVKVSDTGIGISKEQLPNIFDRFYRVDKARSRDKGGTGLGLAIAKQTVESAFKGKILITSELNKGTDVTVSIPIPKK